MSRCAHRVLIAGAGVAGLEGLAALRSLAGERVDITLVAPTATFALRADAVTAPFGLGTPVEHDVATIAADHDARFVEDELSMIYREVGTATLRGGGALSYESLLVAVGAPVCDASTRRR